MKNLFKDAMMFSLGSANLAKEVIEDFADEMIRSGKAQMGERTQIVDELNDKAKQVREDFESGVKDVFNTMFSQKNTVTKEEYEALLKRVEDLESKLAVKGLPEKVED